MLAHASRRALLSALTFLAILSPAALAVAAPGLLPLADEARDATPVWREISRDVTSIRLEFTLEAFRVDDVEIDGETWRALSLDGGAILGEDGAPGRPAATRLVAVPRGAKVTARVVSETTTPLSPLRLFPVQPGHAAEFTVDRAAYAADKAAAPRLRVGAPAVMAGRGVVPITICPLDYDAATGAASAARAVEIELSWAGGETETRPQPASFDAWMDAHVSGRAADKAGAESTYGTWALVRHGDSAVADLTAPLEAWRARQGYHVEIVDVDVVGNTTSAIKSALQSLYDDDTIPPLEFVVLAGDESGTYGVPTWTETVSSYAGPGDHYYVTLDGDDILADAHLGRLSFEDVTDLEVIVDKILGYEQSPPMDDTDWYSRASLMGDESDSGITTIYVNQWLKGHLEALGWAEVDTTWSGSFTSALYTTVNPGVNVFGYRGYYGMSGIGTSHIINLSNGERLPVAVLPTCDTGTITDSECRSEAWLRAANGGAIAAVGTATIGTHTRYNNCYYHGIWNGLLYNDDHRVGVAHSLGKLELYLNYEVAQPDVVEIWSTWNSLIGDPATDPWLSVPATLDVTHPASLPPGATAVPVSVSVDGAPAAGLAVCAYLDGAFQVSAYTDAAGEALLPVPEPGSGTVLVTVTGHDHLPYLGEVPVAAATAYCGLADATLGGSGLLTPDDEVELSISVSNAGTATASGVSATLGAGTPYGTVSGGSLSFGDIAAGATASATTTATVSVPADATGGTSVAFPLLISAGGETWSSVVTLEVSGPALGIADVAWATTEPAPGESADLVISLDNDGSLDAAGVTATLTSSSPWVIVSDGEASYGDLLAGGGGDNAASPFVLTIANDCYVGHLVNLELSTVDTAGRTASLSYPLQIGKADTDDPLGPDAYGYYAYDDTDVSSGLAPTYDWIAIDPDNGGAGTDAGLSDGGWEQDDTVFLDLPFTFRYYGQDYDRVSVCSNGWMAVGEMNLVHYRNFGIPSAGSPGAMIAPFWDNLYQTGTHRVYTWYDESEHRWVVQWYGMPNDYSNAQQNFEVVLYDPSWHQTSTGDGMILFQYETVANTDSRDAYATVGIQNAARDDGLMYSYWNVEADAAAPLAAGRAILFMPLGEILQPTAEITPAALETSAASGGTAETYLHLGNTGEAGSVLNYDIEVVDPLTRSTEKNLSGSDVKLNASQYEPGTTVSVDLSVSCVSDDWEWIVLVVLDLPDGVSLDTAGSLSANHTMAWNGETGDGVSTSWGTGSAGGGYLDDGEVGHATITLSFDTALSGDVEIGWEITGDQYGSSPHELSGTLTLEPTDPAIYVTAPLAGEVAVIGESLDVTFLAVNGPETATVELQRSSGGAWETLASGVDLSAGVWSWTVSGDPGPYAVIRVTDEVDTSISGLSGVFAVGRDMGWLTMDTSTGQLAAGASIDITLTCDANGLEDGEHAAEIDVVHNGGPAVTIPLTFTVGSQVDASAPEILALLGCHPNPFNPQTVISFALPERMPVTLKVYSARGRLVRTLLGGDQPAGVHRVLWDGRDATGRELPSGVYLYRLTTPEGAMSGKAALLK